MSSSTPNDALEGIAIVGMSGRFPGAPNLDAFWKNLCDGVESITFFRNDELARSISTPADLDTPNFIKAGPILDDVETFDASFFGYTPRDAEIIDPQHRLFLECAWEALEHAGYDSERYKGWIAVYGGLGLPSYLLNNLYQNNEMRALVAGGSLQVTTANSVDYLATRVSYKLNLKGPSITLQTACSTSLVAIHLGCQSLMNYQCDMALAGGVSVHIPQKDGYWYQEGGILSPDGHCRTFDARARGTVFGSGVGIVVLKRLSDALAQGDQIYALIKGSAVNNDGSLKVGFTAPSVEGQTGAVAMALGMAGVDPETISYVEAHGTATSVGDPIEIAALTQVFRASTQKKGFCAVGSVKSNIGHANTAAGIAGLIKTVLALKHRMLPANLHFESPNPKIDFANSPFYVNTTLAPWNGPTPLRAGVSSFGVGGTNAHLVIEEAPPLDPSDPARPWQLLTLSARTESALDAVTTNLVEHMRQQPDLNLADLAYTLQVGRRAFSYRRVLVCRDLEDAVSALETRDPKRVLTSGYQRGDRPVVFMFSGQGAQYVNMARDLYQSEPVFREQVDRCAQLLRPHLGLDLREVLYPDLRIEDRGLRIEGTESSILNPLSSVLDQTALAQPALFVIEYALAQLWMAWGIRPQAMIGHSIGEYVAACLAGVFSLDDALALVAARGRLMQELPGGAMLAVPLPEEEAQALLGDQLSLAAVNGPSRCVVAGPADAIDELERQLAARGVDGRRLHTSHAFHSRMMEPILEPFMKHLYAVRLRAPSIPYLSNVTGAWITPEQALTPSYWAQHLRQTVRFGDGLRELLKEPQQILLEVGPGQTLSTLARQSFAKTGGQTVLASLRHPNDQQPDRAFLLSTLGQLWLAGMSIDWDTAYAHERRRRIALPTYPFERQRYWIEPSEQAFDAQPRAATLDKKPNIADWFYIPSWKRSIPPVQEPGALAGRTACWLVFGDACGLGARLTTQLASAGLDAVVTVTAGEQFERHGEHSYTLNPHQPEAYDLLFKELRESNRLPATIVHLWSVLPDDQALSRDERFERAQDLGFYSLLFLAQALGRQNLTDSLQIAIVSNNMQRVAGEALLCPEKATLLGPCKVIPQEYPNISCRSIDIVLHEPGSGADELADQLIAELTTPSSDPIVAYRGFDRWVQTYEMVPLGEAIEGRTRLRQGGVYLITGGLGGIGLVLAEYLAQAVQAKLVLTGRSTFPAREEWSQWLAMHEGRDKVSRQIQALRKLEELGAEVLVVSADASDAASMGRVVHQACERFGPFNGIIHAAGVPSGGMIQLKTSDLAAHVLAPKVNAVRALEQALAGVDLDFLVLCSSTTAVIGGMGQVDYCAANAFLDAYAHYNTSVQGVFTVSINWDAWQEVGMAVDVAASYGLLDGRPTPRVKDIAHPLLDARIQETAGEEVYLSALSPANHWVLSEHRIMGTPALPGTAYLEMARAAFQQRAAGATIELREVFFLSPFMVGLDEQKEAHTILEGDGDVVAFRILSRAASKEGVEPAWQEHARGKIARLDNAPPPRHSIEDIKATCGTTEVTSSAEDVRGMEKFVQWGPRWMSLKRATVGSSKGLAVIELPEAFLADLEEFGLHPALLDVATAFGNGLVGEGEAYLPLSYKRLRVYGPLTQRLYSYVRYRADDTAQRETISFDITILDEQGQELVDIESFTLRRANEAAGRLREAAMQESGAAEYALNGPEPGHIERNGDRPGSQETRKGRSSPTIGLLSQEGVDAFKRILSRNKLPQIIVSTRDLHATIERVNTLKQTRILEEIEKAQVHKPSHPRPEMRTAYADPRNEIERSIAQIWQGVLGIEQVGIHDNFFELGGDSVLAIQVIAKFANLGVQLTPAQLFQYQTIAELATVVGLDERIAADQGPLVGTIPLTPIQHWFFEQNPPNPHHWNQALLLEAPETLDPIALEQAVQAVVARHDALRLRFTPREASYEQVCAEAEEHLVFSSADLSEVSEAEQGPALLATAAELQASLNLAEGPLVQVALFHLGANRPRCLLLIVHHLAADEASLRIVLEDLWTAYGQASLGAAIQLPLKTASFKRWADQLAEYARSEDPQQELGYWLAQQDAPITLLPLDSPAGVEANLEDSARTWTVELDAEATRALLEGVETYRVQVEDVLLAALGEAFALWTGERALLVDLESSVREGIFDSLDLSRTAGWFTARFPLRVDLSTAFEPAETLKTVKEQRRAIPNRGIGYGALRYLGSDADIAAQLRAQPQAEMSFRYLGRLPVPETAPFRLAQAASGPAHNPHGRRPYLLEVDGSIAENQLRIAWTYSEHVHYSATIARLAQDFLAALQVLIAHCQSSQLDGYSPSDFPEAGLDQESLDKFMINLQRRPR